MADSTIPESDAQSIIANSHAASSIPDASKQSVGNDGNDDTESFTYEIMNLPPNRYLCSIPHIPPPAPENETATEVAMAQQAEESSRAAASGWDLVAQPKGACLYFVSGWWSYSFCNNRKVVQYHAIASGSPGQPPTPDPSMKEYVLGSERTIPESAKSETAASSGTDAVPAELQVNGDKPYLTQKLIAGTICDLTLRPRTIEVQYHCVPGMKGDKISWVKEVTICSYVMVVNTGRLCDDVAFRPPAVSKPNPISCQLIAESSPSSLPRIEYGNFDFAALKAQDKAMAETDKKLLGERRQVVGDVTVGSRNILADGDEPGKPKIKVAASRNIINTYASGDYEILEIIARTAQADDGKEPVIEVLGDEELRELNLKGSQIEAMVQRLEEISGGTPWKLVLVQMTETGTRELRVFYGTDDEDEQDVELENTKKKTDAVPKLGKKKEKEKDTTGKTQTKATKKPQTKAKGGKAKDTKPKAEEEEVLAGEDGSTEEFFKDEL